MKMITPFKVSSTRLYDLQAMCVIGNIWRRSWSYDKTSLCVGSHSCFSHIDTEISIRTLNT